MPFGDGTGPLGIGPLTGRKADYCAGSKVPGYRNAFPTQNFGIDRRRGYRRILWAAGLIAGCAYLAHRWANRGQSK